MAVEHGLHALLETPIAHDLREADAIIAAAEQRGVYVEVAGQFHRRPLEQLKLKLIAAGVFGSVYTSFNDFAGHGYHGISVMRSYLGFDAQPLTVTGAVQRYGLTSYYSRLANTAGPRDETQEHGIITFAGGRLGIFHWTNVGYDSPLRWWRSSRFLAEKGMGITVGTGLDVEERLSLLAPGGEAPRFITVERRWERVDGGALAAMSRTRAARMCRSSAGILSSQGRLTLEQITLTHGSYMISAEVDSATSPHDGSSGPVSAQIPLIVADGFKRTYLYLPFMRR